MPTSLSDIKKRYPLPIYQYKVEIYPYLGSIAALVSVGILGGDTWGFSEISGLESHFEHQVYRDGLSYNLGPDLLRGLRQPLNITLKRGVVPKRSELADWMQMAYYPLVDFLRKKNMRIIQVDAEGNPVVAWNITGAMPVRLSGPQFNAKDESVSIESIEVVAERMDVDFNP